MTARLPFVLACVAAGCRAPAAAPDVDAAPTAIALDPSADVAALDPTFGTDGWLDILGSVAAIAIQPDQKLLLCGTWSTAMVAGGPGMIARLLPDGAYDPTFGVGGLVPIAEPLCHRIAVLTDGRVVTAGGGVTVLSADGVLLDRLSTLPAHGGLSGLMPVADGGFVTAGTQVYLQGFSMMWRIALVRYTQSLLPSLGFGIDGVAVNPVPTSTNYNPVGLAMATDAGGAPHLLVSYSSGVRSVNPVSGALDGIYNASPVTDGRGIAISARGALAFGAYARSDQIWSLPVGGAGGAAIAIDVGYGAVLVQDAALRPIVTRALPPTGDVEVHPVRLTTSPFAVDAPWTASHAFTLPSYCGHAPPCETPPLDTRTTAVVGAVMTAGDQLVLLGTQSSSAGPLHSFVARLRP